ncbi:MAG TPA: hypothetical protein VFL29_01620 [Candidatus Dormibacteraeota bacterium]|nr:hypothetical protein [Candidatus Dormibacteraeota bacterium]
MTLQAILVVVLAAAGGFAIYNGTFVTGMIHDELVSQQIYFPGTDQVKTGGSLDPKEFPAEITQYAGTQVDTGDKARVYANDFIGKHLEGVANGQTYAQISSKLQADNAKLAAMSKDDPGYADLQKEINTLSAQRTTVFQGDTLRSSLLNAYGWYTVGTYSIYAGIGLMLAALVVLGALVFELFVAGRKPEMIKIAQTKAA